MSFRRLLKPGWIILWCILVFFLVRFFFAGSNFDYDRTVMIQKGDSFQEFLEPFSRLEKFRIKWFLRKNSDALGSIAPGTYNFEGSYSIDTFLEKINSGPDLDYTRFTVLEGWSIYDIDDALTKKGIIQSGDYIAKVSDENYIRGLVDRYEFVSDFLETKPIGNKITLEGLLYPDTYHIDKNTDPIIQLIQLQLNAFRDKVAVPYFSQINLFSKKLADEGYSYKLSFYNIVNLASVIEKEERQNKNKATIASIFLNRIEQGMRIDADITLCYGLRKSYRECTPSVIVASIRDAKNLYNTRVHTGLPPTPIANPSLATFEALLNFQVSDYYYYLHDSTGQIRYASDLAGHNSNKRKYL